MISSATLTRITTDPIYIELKKKIHAPAGNQTRVSSVAGTYTITVLPAHVFVLGFEPRISRVLGERHNQARPYEHWKPPTRIELVTLRLLSACSAN